MRGNNSISRCCASSCYFNSRLCMRGNKYIIYYVLCQDKFQFTPLHERQQAPQVFKNAVNKFQFTPLHERQRFVISLVALAPYFNSRLCMRGNLCQLRHFRTQYIYFNSRLCMRGNEFSHAFAVP